MTDKTPAYPTRYTAKGTGPMCWARECMWPGENKGPLNPGKGYAYYYYDKPIACCMRNHLRGCPSPVPEPDIDKHGRCCAKPAYLRRGSAPVGHRACETCGAFVSLAQAKLLNKLEPRR